MIGTIAEWAEKHKISRVAAWRRIKKHDIPKLADGKLDFEEADRIWEASVNAIQQQRGQTQPKPRRRGNPKKAASAGPQKGSLSYAQLQHEEAKVVKARLEAAKLEGKLIEIRTVEANWCDIAGRIRDGLMGLPSKICTHLPSEWRSEVTAAIDEEVRRILAALHDEIRPDSKAA
jgi:phage terminase Nu1 subunit (DNA packaging protein)